jgi:hypothetical protein
VDECVRLDIAARRRETRWHGENRIMPFRLLLAGRAAALMVAFIGLFAAGALAQTDQPQTTAELTVALQPLQSTLASLEVTARYASSDQEFADLAPRVT